MTRFVRFSIIAFAAVALVGCASGGMEEFKSRPGMIFCPLLGVVAGGAIAAGAFDGDDGAMAAGAAVGAAVGYLMCREEERAPAPKPRPKPKPKPKPKPCVDSDGDGVCDDKDECPSTPAGVKVNAVGCPEVGETLVSLQGINFDHDKSTIRPDMVSILSTATTELNDAPSVHARVEGHTDSDGSDAYNLKLSQRRAQAVVDYLVSRGIDGSRLSPVGYGEGAPVAPNDTPENKYKNRRVDLVVTEN
jgi:OOP family OmpA-OmpF porin